MALKNCCNYEKLLSEKHSIYSFLFAKNNYYNNLFHVLIHHIITSFDCKSKTNRKNIEKILQHFALRKIQSSLYAGKLEKNELELLMKKLMKS